MKYQVLARKYRPKTFSTMIGQEHVLKALGNALESERLHHAYLFTGTRGVGKTTVARVLAKALNCEQGISASPCGECPACQEIDQGRFIDLIEVDAASRTKVEDTRELLDNVMYAPTRGRFKIYLIDEVHMLSTHSFNALLKTLEEPPPHVKFLLATTDPQKLPVTILSRCLQFNLKRLTIEQIEQQLDNILNAENVPFEKNVLKPLAIAADGSMRDALSLLDQSIAYCNGSPNLADIEAMLGCVQKDRIFELITALVNEDGRSLVEQSRILSDQGIDVNTILAELITMLQRIALSQLVPDAIDDSLGDKEAVETLAQAISPEDIQLYYQIALNGRKDLPFSPQPQGGFEMILLRLLAFKPAIVPTAEKKTLKFAATVKTPVEQAKPKLPPKTQSPAAITAPDDFDLPPVDAYGQENFTDKPEQEIPLVQPEPEPTPDFKPQQQETRNQTRKIPETETQLPCKKPNGSEFADYWHELVNRTEVTGLEQQLGKHCALVNKSEQNGVQVFELLLESVHKHLCSDKIKNRLVEALQQMLGLTIKLDIKECQIKPEDQLHTPRRREILQAELLQQQAVESISSDPKVKMLVDAFTATVREETIKPV